MTQFLNFGNSGDGVGNLSGTDAPIDSTFTGTGGTSSGTGQTGKSFAAGDLCIIHQSRNTNAGNWEMIQVATYSSVTGAFTFESDLDNTYTSGAQIIKLKQYSSVNISSSFTVKAWNGSVGGILAFLCNGKTTITSSVIANGGQGSTGGNGTAGGTGGG